MASPGELLYLFSSNIRPLYVQDILDVLAAPPGTRYQFRYEEGYVAASAREARGLKNALVLFAIQQEAQYHEPAFIPVRRAEIVTAAPRAGIFVVDFIVTDYVALAGTLTDNPTRDDLATAVRGFTAALGDASIDRPYTSSASVGPDIADVDSEVFEKPADENSAFRATARTLQRTEWFRDARFMRVLSIKADGDRELAIDRARNAYVLQAGNTYDVELTHYQPAGFTGRAEFTISADGEIVHVIGRAGFDISSRYDIVRIPVHAGLPPRDEARETVLAIEPAPNVQGPTIRLLVQVVPPTGRAWALTGLSAIVLTLFGLPAVVTSMPQWLKFILVLIGALAAGFVQNFGGSVSVPSGFGFTAKPAKNGSEAP